MKRIYLQCDDHTTVLLRGDMIPWAQGYFRAGRIKYDIIIDGKRVHRGNIPWPWGDVSAIMIADEVLSKHGVQTEG